MRSFISHAVYFLKHWKLWHLHAKLFPDEHRLKVSKTYTAPSQANAWLPLGAERTADARWENTNAKP